MAAPACAMSIGGPFLSSMLSNLDCQARTIGANGYSALATPGSATSVLLATSLTIFIALLGYGLLFGDAPGPREGAMLVAKVGMALLLATSWPAFRTLAYDVALDAPSDLASTIARSAGLPGASDGLVDQLQAADDALSELQTLGTGRPPEAEAGAMLDRPAEPDASSEEALAGERRTLLAVQDRPRFDPQRDGRLIGQARTVFLTSTIAAYASVRLIAGLLLALGPLFALFLLFSGTVGIFIGWIRVLVGVALGSLATSVILGLELSLAIPWLDGLISARLANQAVPGAAIELLAFTVTFALILAASLVAMTRVAYGLPAVRGVGKVLSAREMLREAPPPARDRPSAETGSENPERRSRASDVAAAAASAQRRGYAALNPWAPDGATDAEITTGAAAEGRRSSAERLGQGGRRTSSRVSAAAVRRDRGR